MRLYSVILSLFLIISLPEVLDAQYHFNVKRTLRETNHQVFHASYSPDGKYILTTGSDNSIILWNTESGIIYRTLTGLRKRPNVAVISSDNGTLLSAGEDNVITMWDPLLLKVVHTFAGHQGPVKSLDLSIDGRYLASGSADKTIRVWQMRNRELLYELKAHKKNVNALAFSPDGRMLASGGADKTLVLWSMQNGNILASKPAHKGWISDAAFSPDGKLLASCGYDKLIHIWELPGLNLLNTLEGHKDWVQTICFSPDGKHLISGGHDQLLILWDVGTGKILNQSDKQGQVVLSVDIHPGRPDFVSSSLLSEEIRVWALTGLDLAQWEGGKQTGLPSQEEEEMFPGVRPAEQAEREHEAGKEVTEQPPQTNPLIEIFAPLPVQGRVAHDRNEIVFIGRVSDPEGIDAFMVNHRPIKLSDAGVFQVGIGLAPGSNMVNLVAVSKSGKMNEYRILVDCTSEASVAEKMVTPDIQKGKYFALLIGINEYHDMGITDLDNPIRDAESLARVLLSDYNFDEENMVVLKNPGRADIMLALDELGRKLTANDNLLIFYAGHGHWDDKGKVGYWLPSDASKSNTVDWFRNSTLRDFIGSIQTRHTLLIADACFSGAIFKTRAAFSDVPKGIQKLYELPSRKAMTSGILQEVPDESVFVKYLIKRLEENEEDFMPSEFLFSSFKTAVMNNSPTVPQYGTIQNVGDEGGDFVFIKK